MCDHCKKPGHVKKDCFELVGYPPGWQQRQINKYYMKNNHEKKQDGAHFTSSAEGLSPITLQAFEEFKAKLMPAATEGQREASSSSGIEGEKHLITPWIIDSGATNHMTGSPRYFSSYTPRSGKDRVRIADGSSAPIMGCGTVNCAPSLPLNFVLHVPNFPENLLSVSSITRSLNCGAWFEPKFCVLQELKSGRIIGTGTERDGLYYLDNTPSPAALTTRSATSTDELFLLHCRLGHLSFQSLGRMFPSYFESCCKENLVCEVCDLAKHTIPNYPSSGERCKIPFEVVHSDVWRPSKVTSLLGEQWYVKFIDGFSICTWLYLLKKKSKVLSAFINFYTLVNN